jgi:hypothetical protein
MTHTHTKVAWWCHKPTYASLRNESRLKRDHHWMPEVKTFVTAVVCWKLRRLGAASLHKVRRGCSISRIISVTTDYKRGLVYWICVSTVTHFQRGKQTTYRFIAIIKWNEAHKWCSFVYHFVFIITVKYKLISDVVKCYAIYSQSPSIPGGHLFCCQLWTRCTTVTKDRLNTSV